MKVCKKCNIFMSDQEVNCPVCGAMPESTMEEGEIMFCPYPVRTKKPANKIVKEIFDVLCIMALIFALIFAVIFKSYAIITITATIVVMIWLNVLQFIFHPTSTRSILTKIPFYLSIFSFFLTLYLGVTYISICYVIPIILFICNCTYMMIVFISGKWYRYAFCVSVVCFMEVLFFILSLLLKYNIIVSLIAAGLGIITMLFSLIFGRSTLAAEFRKRFFL